MFKSAMSAGNVKCTCLNALLLTAAIVFNGTAHGDSEQGAKQNTIAEIDIKQLVAEGEKLRNVGNLLEAQNKFDLAQQLASKDTSLTPALLAAIETASGYNLFLLGKMEAAEQQLTDAYQKTAFDSTYLHALAGEYLGNLFLANGEKDEAIAYFNAALKSAEASEDQALQISLELLRLTVTAQTDAVLVRKLPVLANRINQLKNDFIKAKLQLSFSQTVLDLDISTLKSENIQPLIGVVHQMLNELLQQTDTNGSERFRAEALTDLAHLYRLHSKNAEALILIDRAIELAGQSKANELLTQLYALKGDLLQLQGDNESALSNYELAIRELTKIRADLPFTFPDGRSAINVFIDPIYRNYVDLLFKSADGKNAETVKSILFKVINNMEVIKEADMQDYFLGKCAINDSKPQDWRTKPLPDAAIVYPVLFSDRAELVIKTDHDIFRRTVNVSSEEIKTQIHTFAKALQAGKPFRTSAQKLYEWLLSPVRPELERSQIKTLVYVPDRDMRAIPFAAFNDGKKFAVEDYSIVTMPSLAFQNFEPVANENEPRQELFAGLSLADGPSIDKLPKKVVAEITNAENSESGALAINPQRTVLSENLSLPSVEKEINVLAVGQPSKILMNGQFTTKEFKLALESGDFNKVHIASHGFFGHNAKDSFILAYDAVLSLAEIQASLGTEKLKQNPISLLTLSACETAQGNDRMLLGFSGMAIKSNVRSALGSLWTIDDEGAMEFMKLFYAGLNKSLSKAQALQTAQVEMVKSARFKHPYYWSPFILTGMWQ